MNKPVNVALTLPAGVKKLEKQSANLFEISLATGSGPAVLTTFREHLLKEGWTEEKERELGKTRGFVILKKDFATLTLSYFDLGFGDVDIRVSGTKNVVLEPIPSKEKIAEAPKAVKKHATPAIPGLPELPPGVELPDDVKQLLKKALEESGNKTPPTAKKPRLK